MHRIDIARSWVARVYPDAVLAVVGGSAARGVATAYSDVDIVVCGDGFVQAMWKTIREEDIIFEVWEVPIHLVPQLFAVGVAHANPTLQRIICEGVCIQETPQATRIVAEAHTDWDNGPWALSDAERDEARFRLTHVCDDVRTSTDALSCALLMADGTEQAMALWLRMHRCWVATGKQLWYDFQKAFPVHAAQLERVCIQAFAHPMHAQASWIDAIGALIAVAGGWLRDGYVAVCAEDDT
ncbi:MAG: nucleotidyltransferase domain-containing protein [Paenibacillaceae bacterium]|nr:nucleotidyltransferase domain-containing protein [Paenibacillaceae bacterium]